MNEKVANVIAVELAILIGLMSWLIYSRFPSTAADTAAEMEEGSVVPFATVASVSKPRNQRPHTMDYRADRERVAVADKQPVPTAQEYDQEIATQPYADSGHEDGSTSADSPTYAEADQEPAVAQSDDLTSPQTVAYAQPSQIVVYSQPAQIIVFSTPRRFTNRRRLTPRPGAFMATNHRRPDRVGPNTSEDGILPRQNPNAPSYRPTQGFGARGHR
jgi:hypothetical protein